MYNQIMVEVLNNLDSNLPDKNNELLIPAAIYRSADKRFSRFCLSHKLDNLGPNTNEDGIFTRTAIAGGDFNPGIRLTIIPNNETDELSYSDEVKVLTDIGADIGTKFMRPIIVSSFITSEENIKSFGRRLMPRLRKTLKAAKSITEDQLTEIRYYIT